MKKIQSSWIDKVYSNKRKRVIIIETKGQTYTYQYVSPQVIDQLRAIIKRKGSVGQFINTHIKPYYSVNLGNKLKLSTPITDRVSNYNVVKVDFVNKRILGIQV